MRVGKECRRRQEEEEKDAQTKKRSMKGYEEFSK